MGKTMKIDVIRADITTLKVDVIVNAANCSLLGGGGVDGAIHKAAGKGLLKQCKALVNQLPGHRGKSGEAYLTGGCKLHCKYVIHTAGPIWGGGKHNEATILANCYINSLRLADEKQCESIAFPCISTGIYKYPPDAAAKIAYESVRSFEAEYVKNVIFCCFTSRDEKLYQQLMAS